MFIKLAFGSIKVSKHFNWEEKRRQVKAVPSRKATHDFSFAIVTEPVFRDVVKIPSLHNGIYLCLLYMFQSKAI